jgi:hypothetical protein
MAITLQEAKDLKYGDVLYHVSRINADGSPQRWKVNGKPKVWKTRPKEVKVPVKYGFWTFDYLTEDLLSIFCLDEEEASK